MTFRTDNEPFKVFISPIIPYFLPDDDPSWLVCKVYNECGIRTLHTQIKLYMNQMVLKTSFREPKLFSYT